MGCFDYECTCGGKTCIFKGGQDGLTSDVVVEVPLNDGTTVFIEGEYDSYGSVKVGEYTFYPDQFEDFFDGWLGSESDEARSNIFLASRIWTLSYYREADDYDMCRVHAECFPGHPVSELTPEILSKCIRADKDLNIPTDTEKQKARIERLKAQVELMQKELGRTLRP